MKDQQSGEPIPYVNMGIPHQNYGTVTGADGTYILDSIALHLEDTFRISSVGYQILYKTGQQIQSSPEIQLLPEVIELREVVVSGDQLKEKTIGNQTRSKAVRAGFRQAELGHEIGSLFKISGKSTSIKRFQTHIIANTHEQMKFRLNFYSIKDGLPDQKLVQQNILFNIDTSEGPFSLDLEPYDITLKENFYCTVELIESQRPEDVLFFSAGFLNKKLVWRETSHATWEKLGLVGIGFHLIVEQ